MSGIILSSTNKLSKQLKQKNTVITVGVFDGIHLGHQKILQKTISKTQQYRNAQAVVLTFQEHPLKILSPTFCPPLLLLNQEKIERIAASGIDIIINQHFTKRFANLTATEFVTEILYNSFQIKEIIVGHDHGFGKNATGDVRLLEKLGNQLGFRITIVPPVCYRNIPISSTRIRELLLAGKIKDAATMLSRPHHIVGKVGQGDQRGRILGFPTANLVTKNEVIPGDGVYAVLVEFDGKRYQGIMNIGFRPTFYKHAESTLEIYLFNYQGNLYGKIISVHFIARLRDEMKFPTPSALIAQIKKDVLKAKQLLKT